MCLQTKSLPYTAGKWQSSLFSVISVDVLDDFIKMIYFAQRQGR